MIRSSADPETEKIFSEERSRRFPSDIHERALAKLRLVDAASDVDDLRMPPEQSTSSSQGKAQRILRAPNQRPMAHRLPVERWRRRRRKNHRLPLK